MKSKIILIAAVFCFSIIQSCSKSSDPKPQPQSCTNASDCIINTWNIQTFYAKLTSGSSVNLTGGAWQWIFTNNLWTENVDNAFHESGPWKIFDDETTLQLMGNLDTTVWTINSIDDQNLSVWFQFDHAHPDQASINVAGSAGIDTANLTGFTAVWVKKQ